MYVLEGACVCVYVCVWWTERAREKEKGGDESEQLKND